MSPQPEQDEDEGYSEQEFITPPISLDSCPRSRCNGELEAERRDEACYELVCQQCGRTWADWQPGMPDWEMRQAAPRQRSSRGKSYAA